MDNLLFVGLHGGLDLELAGLFGGRDLLVCLLGLLGGDEGALVGVGDLLVCFFGGSDGVFSCLELVVESMNMSTEATNLLLKLEDLIGALVFGH